MPTFNCFLVRLAEVMDFALKYPIGRDYFLKQVRGRVMKLTKGVYPAPLRIIDVSIVHLFIHSFIYSGYFYSTSSSLPRSFHFFVIFARFDFFSEMTEFSVNFPAYIIIIIIIIFSFNIQSDTPQNVYK